MSLNQKILEFKELIDLINQTIRTDFDYSELLTSMIDNKIREYQKALKALEFQENVD